jgi:hypothetical protein
MKKKLLVLLIAVIPTLMPNLASAVAIEIDVGECRPNMIKIDPKTGKPVYVCVQIDKEDQWFEMKIAV